MAAIVLFVTMLDGKRLAIDVKPEITVEDFKANIYEKEGIPINQQRLYYEGKLLMNENTLASYNLVSGTVLRFKLFSRGGGSPMFFLSVIMPSCKVIQTVVDGTTTIGEVMKTVQSVDRSVRTSNHRLMMAGMAMDNNKTLGDYGIISESVLRVDRVESTCSFL
ncbi:polyubiquitin-like [Penaeus indicus]|uniref:polyubiquitin-like n=1 Tax=Penaeus indicus TaxID=29960 RepID=UPI00300D5066